MASSIHAPEAVAGQGLEVPFGGIEHDRDLPQHLPESGSIHQKEARLPIIYNVLQKPWVASHLRVLTIGVIVAGSIIIGAIGGVIGSRVHPHTRSACLTCTGNSR